MKGSGVHHDKALRRELTSEVTAILVIGIIITSPTLRAQQSDPKASVDIMVEGVTPIGEIRIVLPPGTDFVPEEKYGDILRLRKGPFNGSVPFNKTTLWHPPPSPTPSPVAKPPKLTSQGVFKPDSHLARFSKWPNDFWSHHRVDIMAMALTAVLLSITLTLTLKLTIGAILRRRAYREMILRHELKLARHDLKELNALIEGHRNRFLEIERELASAINGRDSLRNLGESPGNGNDPFQTRTSDSAAAGDKSGDQPLLVTEQQDFETKIHIAELAASGQCPHCGISILLSSLHGGANRCTACSGDFLYE